MKDIFAEWLERHVPERRDKVLNRVREIRGGALNDGRFGVRGRGEGPWAEQLRGLYRITRDRLRLDRPPELSTESFRVPVADPGPQMELFD